MNFLCSILVLIGIVALNDASLSYEEEMQIINDQMMLEELRNMAMDRNSNSVECSQELLDNLSQVMAEYNSDMKKCEDKRKNTIKALNAAAMKIIDSYNRTAQSSCVNLDECASIELALDSLKCYEEKGSDEAVTFTNMSNDISTEKIKMQTDIEYAVSAEDVCTTKAYANYSRQSDSINADFSDCVHGKKPTAATSVAPTETTNDDKENDKNPNE